MAPTNDFHFRIKELAKTFEVHLKCLGQNTFSVPIKKELNIKTIT